MIFSLREERTVSNKTLIGIRELRRPSGWTQTRAARASSINHARISMAENCEIQLTAEEELRLRRVLLAEIHSPSGLTSPSIQLPMSPFLDSFRTANYSSGVQSGF